MLVREIDTPALLVDLDAMESNLNRMAAFFQDTTAKLRPHFKNHKVPLLAWRQVQAGAIGMTCATLREAEILVNHGIRNILIANEVAGEQKINWFADLSRHADLILGVDSERTVSELACVARKRNIRLNILVDVNVGLNRCGVPGGEPARTLANFAVKQGLRCRGLMGYDGHLQVLPQSAERDELVTEVARTLIDSRKLIERDGIPVEIVSTGGTGTYAVSGVYPGITEIQAGSYLLMDTLYVNRGSVFTPSLTVLATVVSTPEPHRAVIDCGVKALSAERGLSTIKGLNGVELKALHAEHGLLEIQNAAEGVTVGQQIELWVRYSDATVNLHERMHGVRNGRVEHVFRIEH